MPQEMRGANSLTVASQDGIPMLWVLVDTDANMEHSVLCVVATGQTVDPADLTYIGSVHDVGGWMVVHIFEKRDVCHANQCWNHCHRA